MNKEQQVNSRNKWAVVTTDGRGQTALSSKDLKEYEDILQSLKIPYKVFSFIYSVDVNGERNYR